MNSYEIEGSTEGDGIDPIFNVSVPGHTTIGKKFYFMFNPSDPEAPNWRISIFEKRLYETETL